MKLLCILTILSHNWIPCVTKTTKSPGNQTEPTTTKWTPPWLEKHHDPLRYTTPRPRIHYGAPLPAVDESPDFRVEETMPIAFRDFFYGEENRPYRLSPSLKQISVWDKYKPEDLMTHASCYCTTVYKRLIPLAGCALITTRHILTTATSTYLVLRDRMHYEILENVLGAWYDTNHNNYNSSMYLSPARIHYHPRWHYPEQVNRSHPLSFSYDLAVWATTYTVYGWYQNNSSATVCMRATSAPKAFMPPSPKGRMMFVIVGFQFMYSFKRKPTPWHKYGVRTSRYTEPCPKTEWGWFICIPGDWARFGVESGAALHRTQSNWKTNGLLGMAAFSMTLRATEITHYFTIIDTHTVLDFLYDAYDSRLPYIWLDKRFEDTKLAAPQIKEGFYLKREYVIGDQHPYGEPYWN